MPSEHTCVRVCVCEPPGRGGVEGACEPVAGVVECEWIVLGKAACACEREHVWLGVRGCVSAHWACVQPQVGTPGADLLAWCWVLSQGGGACSPVNQPSLPDSASPPQQDPRTLWVCPLVHPQLVPSLPFGAYGTLGDPGWHSAY